MSVFSRARDRFAHLAIFHELVGSLDEDIVAIVSLLFLNMLHSSHGLFGVVDQYVVGTTHVMR